MFFLIHCSVFNGSCDRLTGDKTYVVFSSKLIVTKWGAIDLLVISLVGGVEEEALTLIWPCGPNHVVDGTNTDLLSPGRGIPKLPYLL